MTSDDSEKYLEQGALDVREAESILPRLEKENLRFQIETDLSSHARSGRDFRDSRVTLFVHADDLAAWEKIRSEFFPL